MKICLTLAFLLFSLQASAQSEALKQFSLEGNAFKGSKLDADKGPASFDADIADLNAQMRILDGHLAGKDFFALGKLTLADIALAPILARCLSFPIDRPSMPALEAWAAGIAARPAFVTATS